MVLVHSSMLLLYSFHRLRDHDFDLREGVGRGGGGGLTRRGGRGECVLLLLLLLLGW